MRTIESDTAIPGTRGRRLLGNTYDYERDRPGFLSECQRKYGDVFRFERNVIVVTDPELVHKVLAGTNTTFSHPSRLDESSDHTARQMAEWMRARGRSGRALGLSMLTAHAARLDRAF